MDNIFLYSINVFGIESKKKGGYFLLSNNYKSIYLIVFDIIK